MFRQAGRHLVSAAALCKWNANRAPSFYADTLTPTFVASPATNKVWEEEETIPDFDKPAAVQRTRMLNRTNNRVDPSSEKAFPDCVYL